MRKLTLLVLSVFALNTYAQDMSSKKIDNIIHKVADSISHESGVGHWYFMKNNCLMVCISDDSKNRMRVVSPIAQIKDLNALQLKQALKANFHTILDPKYAIADGVMWSAFVHPLKELSEQQLISAIDQVMKSNKTFGTTYKSTEFYFNTNREEIKHAESDL